MRLSPREVDQIGEIIYDKIIEKNPKLDEGEIADDLYNEIMCEVENLVDNIDDFIANYNE